MGGLGYRVTCKRSTLVGYNNRIGASFYARNVEHPDPDSLSKND